MRNRRDFLSQTALVGMLACQSLTASPAFAARRKSRSAASVTSIAPSAGSVLRLGGLGDGYKMTIGADGQQLVVVNDGPGWVPPPATFYSIRLWQADGPPQNARFSQLANYPHIDRAERPEGAPSYYGHGVLSVGNEIYQFLATLDQKEESPRHWTGAKLIYSPDRGRTWRNGNGSTPVVLEDWKDQSRDNFQFFTEQDGCFSLLSILQAGRAYSANRDGYIYVYGLNGNIDGLMNQLVMFRVRKSRFRDRSAYRFFAGRQSDGSARWSSDIHARQPVHVFPKGWVNYTNLFPGDLVVESWLPSVVFNESLGLYMMSSAGIGCAPDGTEFGKPSYLGIWVSDKPWGPWKQVHEDTGWTPDGDSGARAYAPQIAPGWIAPDGKSFWLVWSDLKGIREFGRDDALVSAEMDRAHTPQERTTIEAEILRRYMPGFAMSTQRYELSLG